MDASRGRGSGCSSEKMLETTEMQATTGTAAAAEMAATAMALAEVVAGSTRKTAATKQGHQPKEVAGRESKEDASNSRGLQQQHKVRNSRTFNNSKSQQKEGCKRQ
jgi:hypothetical protein